uniref:Uncharacterized protein n=1 Tax=Eutreptiella gymnastica TaxID=73025 RepID=A0A7S4CWU3_9EUGL|mmetsp:Transcript_88393/g.147474  ORF Transcript_88393/g.147474 Transcript_88393/m.147474 type:complete len:106 (-) Transcript_88393:142-459(-)
MCNAVQNTSLPKCANRIDLQNFHSAPQCSGVLSRQGFGLDLHDLQADGKMGVVSNVEAISVVPAPICTHKPLFSSLAFRSFLPWTPLPMPYAAGHPVCAAPLKGT